MHLIALYSFLGDVQFRNGVMQTPTKKFTSPIVYHDDCPLNIGLYQGEYFDGSIDELRVSNTAWSPNWIATGYNNQNDSNSFSTGGSEEEYLEGFAVSSSFCRCLSGVI